MFSLSYFFCSLFLPWFCFDPFLICNLYIFSKLIIISLTYLFSDPSTSLAPSLVPSLTPIQSGVDVNQQQGKKCLLPTMQNSVSIFKEVYVYLVYFVQTWKKGNSLRQCFSYLFFDGDTFLLKKNLATHRNI